MNRRRSSFSFFSRLILISNKMLYLKSRVLRTLAAHRACATTSHKNLIKSFLSFLSGFSIVGLSNMLDKELDWRKPGKRSHR